MTWVRTEPREIGAEAVVLGSCPGWFARNISTAGGGSEAQAWVEVERAVAWGTRLAARLAAQPPRSQAAGAVRDVANDSRLSATGFRRARGAAVVIVLRGRHVAQGAGCAEPRLRGRGRNRAGAITTGRVPDLRERTERIDT